MAESKKKGAQVLWLQNQSKSSLLHQRGVELEK